MPRSFNACWRRRAHDFPGDPCARRSQRTKSISRHRAASRPRSGMVNRFLDRECVRRLAENTPRSYALDLLHFLRWWVGVNHTDAINESALSATVLLDYLLFQSGQPTQPAAAYTNRRVGF